MHTVDERTTLVGVSELRTRLEEILRVAKHSKVIIEKRNEPVAVIMTIAQYKEVERFLDLLEDYELGRMARNRDKRSPAKDYIDFADAVKKLGKLHVGRQAA